MRGRTIPLVMLMPGVAFAQSSAQGDVAVTIYNNDQALVQDTRQINLVRGINRHEFPDVSDSIRPETVRLSIADATIVEQNFDYDLLSPSALIEKAVGQTITIVRTNPATGAETRERAKVLASNNGVVLQIGNSIEVLRDDGLPVRVVYDSLPPNLRARPTLSISLESKAPGTRPGTLSYLTGGLGWSADYVALFDEGKSTIDVQGWVTLRNNNHVAFANTEATLVAGAPGSGGRGGRGGIAPGTLPGNESAARQRLGDFYLYPIDHRVTIARNQQKQVSFLSVGGVPAKKLYRFANGWLGAQSDAVSAQTVLSFSSSRNGGLGDALPAGTVRVYIRDAKGQPQFIGENHIDHTPMGSTLAIPTGEAFDVKVKSTVEKRQTIKSDEWERSAKYRITFGNRPPRVVTIDRSITYYRTGMSYTLTNARPEPVTVEVVQGGLDRGGWEDTRVSSESVPGEQRSFDERVWNVTVPASGQTVLTADFDTRY